MDLSDKIRAVYRTDQRQAFRLLFDACREPLFLYAMHLLGDERAAEDVVQDCFVDFWAHDRIKTVSGDIVKYMFGAVHHCAHNHIRKRRRTAELHRRAGYSGTEFTDEPEREESPETTLLYRSIARLPTQQRRIFMMTAVEGMKYREVADRLSISINTVKTQLRRAVSALRRALTE